MMDGILQADVLRAVGWALIHFLWQGTLLALTGVVALRVIPSARPSRRYALALSLLAMAPIILAATIRDQLGSSGIDAGYTGPTEQLAESTGGARPADAPVVGLAGIGSNPDAAMAALALGWLFIVSVLTIRLALTWRYAARLSAEIAALPLRPDLVDAVDRAFARARATMRSSPSAIVRLVPTGSTPVVLGVVRSVILVPFVVATGLSPDQLEFLLAHELAHVNRRDYLVNLVQSWTETLLFFHPGVRWLSKQVRIERELACDEAVVRAYGRPADYGEALASLALLDDGRVAPALAANASPLVRRIRLLLDGRDSTELAPRRWLLALVAPVGLVSVLAGGQIVAAQSAISTMLDAPPATPVISRHSHRNRHWARSEMSVSQVDDGVLGIDLRLGRRLRGLRFVALVRPRPDGDTVLVDLQVERISWTQRRRVSITPGSTGTPEMDSLLTTFLRESGFNARSRSVAIARAAGIDGLLAEVAQIGDPVVATGYLEAAVEVATDVEARQRLVHAALVIRNESVGAARVVLASMRHATTATELASIVDRVAELPGEAERQLVLVAASRLPYGDAAEVRAAIARALLTLPGEDAREAVRTALANRR